MQYHQRAKQKLTIVSHFKTLNVSCLLILNLSVATHCCISYCGQMLNAASIWCNYKSPMHKSYQNITWQFMGTKFRDIVKINCTQN